MRAVYHANIDELTSEFLENLKMQFKNAKVDIVISDIDETDYLNSSHTNRELLEEAIKEVDNKKFINRSIEDLDL